MLNIDEKAVAKINGFLGRAAIDPSQWLSAMACLNDTVGAVTCSLELTDLRSGETAMECTIDLDASIHRHYEERIFHINPRVAKAMSCSVGHVLDDRLLLRGNDPNTPEFLDWLETTPYYYIQGGKILGSNGHVGFFAANYSKSHGLPGETTARVFEIILPHAVNAIETGRALSGNRLHNVIVNQDTLQDSRVFALLDRAGNITECSAGFEQLLRTSPLLCIRSRQLTVRQARHRRPFELLLQSVLGEERFVVPPTPIRLTGPETPKGIVLRAVPLEQDGNVFDIFRPAALITCVDLDQPARVRREELMALFELTEREADVAALICESLPVDAVAQQLSISEYTVRQHLKSIFGKVGVTRQADLVAIVSRLA